MQAIQTKVLPTANTRGTRIKATCARGSITISYPDLSDDKAHREAVRCLVQGFTLEDLNLYGSPVDGNPWNRNYVTGQLPDGSYAHVYTDGMPAPEDVKKLVDALSVSIATIERVQRSHGISSVQGTLDVANAAIAKFV